MESMGFVYSDYLTKKMRKIANQDWSRTDFLRAMEFHEKKKTFGVGQHLIKTLQVRCCLGVCQGFSLELPHEQGCFDAYPLYSMYLSSSFLLQIGLH